MAAAAGKAEIVDMAEIVDTIVEIDFAEMDEEEQIVAEASAAASELH